MRLSAGERLGPYEIIAPLGAGGMGEVYKARDTRLVRTVAVKVLPAHILQHQEARARFEREARTVASLNHPHICTLFDIGDGYMVLELVDGETLAARIEKGAIPLDQSIAHAIQIADALDRAHRARVIHRDVKPGNIMLTRDGVKVLDFGLAKPDAAPGPTDLTVKNMTAEGAVLGTPQYMAPEQFEGREADSRSDIWAFGAVLYEMATGRKAFQGKNYSSLVAAILAAEPPPMALESLATPWLERLVRRCLQKDPEDRYQSMRDIVLDLQSPPTQPAVSVNSNRFKWVAAALAVLLLALATVHFRQARPQQPFLTTSLLPPEGARFNQIAISPDGKLLAFTAVKDGKRQLWVRPLSRLNAHTLAGTDEASFPFWSPDSRWIGYFAAGRLRKIPVAGGASQVVCDAADVRGGAWSSAGVMLFVQQDGGLFQVSAEGGPPSRIMAVDPGQTQFHSPIFLPDGKHYLYLFRSADSNREGIYLASLAGGEPTLVIKDRSTPGYAPGPSGEVYLLFTRENTLMAQALQVSRRSLTGEPFLLAEKLGADTLREIFPFSASGNGILVYLPESSAGSQLTWVDRRGGEIEKLGDPSLDWFYPWLSNDDTRVAFNIPGLQGGPRDVWVRDLARAINTRVTFHPDTDAVPVFSPRADRIAFSTNRGGAFSLHVTSAIASGKDELLLKSEFNSFICDWSPDGRLLLFNQFKSRTKLDLWILPLDGDRKPVPLLQSEFNEPHGAFSPDGKWIAYVSNESGRNEIYAQPFPATGVKWQISKDGGHWPRWRRDSKELFWLSEAGTMMAVDVILGPAIRPGVPRRLFETGITYPLERFGVAADGKRFLIPLPLNNSQAQPAIVIQNWLAAARSR